MNDDTAINRTSIRRAYQQVADAITARIAAGHYPCKLPSERDLAEEFGVSYITVRHAMAILRERGLIVSIHGRGTLIAPSQPETQPSPLLAAEMNADDIALEKNMASDTPAAPASPDDEMDSTDLETALQNAEQFLVNSGEAVHPDLSARTLLRYLTQYRTHLHAVVTTTRRHQGPGISQHA